VARAGERDGPYCAMGYSGHGVQMATPMGERMAPTLGGDVTADPLATLPAIGAWYELRDRLH